MSYKKKNLADFKGDLASGLYETATGARRAVGKFDGWNPKERDAARKLIDAHFGEAAAAPVKKAAAKKTGKKAAKKAAKTAAPAPAPVSKFKRVAKPPKKVGKKAAKKAASTKTAAPTAVAAPPAPPPAPAAPAPRKGGKAAKAVSAAKPTHVVELAPLNEMITSYEAVQRNLKELQDIDRVFNVKPALSEVYIGLHNCAIRLNEIQDKYWPKSKATRAPEAPAVAAPSESPTPSNGAVPEEPKMTAGFGALPGFPVTTPH